MSVSDEEEIIEAALDLAEATLSLLRTSPVEYSGAQDGIGYLGASLSESLKHPKHAATLKPMRTGVQTIMRKFFVRQGRALLKQINGHLRILGEGNLNAKEASGSDDAKTSVSSAIPDGMLLPLSLTSGMKADYSKALEAALTAGYTNLAADLTSEKEIAADVVGEYLRDHSLTKLTGNLNATTVERLRNALADAYEAGADYDGLVEAVKDEYADFGSVRTGMIAQTEMNAAYNAGRKQIGLDLGFNEKSWNPDGIACPECIAAVLEGWIPIGDDFEAGADAPPLHPSCDCSLDVRFSADAAE